MVRLSVAGVVSSCCCAASRKNKKEELHKKKKDVLFLQSHAFHLICSLSVLRSSTFGSMCNWVCVCMCAFVYSRPFFAGEMTSCTIMGELNNNNATRKRRRLCYHQVLHLV